jgi:hypothetical protein
MKNMLQKPKVIGEREENIVMDGNNQKTTIKIIQKIFIKKIKITKLKLFKNNIKKN